MVASVCLFVCMYRCVCNYQPRSRRDNTFGGIRTGAEWSILVLGFAKYSKRSTETQVSCTLKNITECSFQGAFKMFGRLKWLLFRQVAQSRLITLLMVTGLEFAFHVSFFAELGKPRS